MRDYPTLREVLAIHEELVEQYGGAYGVRDLGAIEAALFRPQSGYYDSIVEEAAALMESLLINHPFVDGNKRVAFAVCHVFCIINDCTFDADPGWLHERMMAWIEERDSRFQMIVNDLRACIK